jgi:predicted phage terminase large subunit-like protein
MDGGNAAPLNVINHPRIEIGHPELVAADREYCSRKLTNFIRRGWQHVEPAQEYVHNWHIDAIGEHLEACTFKTITRLAIAVPPGSMKSLTSSVFFPLWEWGPRNLASMRTIATSHSENLAIRDNLKAKRLVTSDWFQTTWPEVKLNSDQSAKANFENVQTGFRQASPFTSLTGKRGDRVIIDDPLSVDSANSDNLRDRVIETFTEAVPTRLNNPKDSAIIIIAQRLHENDIIGYVVNNDLGYDYLMIQMEFEPDKRFYTSIGWTDPRTEEGQLMFLERFPKEVVERDKKVMGEYAVASQFQQNPVPRKGGMFEVDRIRVIPDLPLGHKFISVRAWDLAGSEGKGAYTVGTKLTYSFESRRWIVEDIRRERFSGAGVRQLIRSTAAQDGLETYIVVPQDPGQAGKTQADDIVAELAGHMVRKEAQSGKKEIRAEPFSAQVGAGNVDLVEGAWNEAFLSELRFFPRGTYKDQVDSVSSAFNFLSKKIRNDADVDMFISGDRQVNWANPF